MKDTIIRGTGNSRSIKSVPNLLTLYPTYESFANALAEVGVPMDICGLNEEGCQQIGDALSKANLLKDATAALYGKPATAVPDDILAAIRPLITEAKNDGLKWEFGSISRALNSTAKSIIYCSVNPKILLVVGPSIYSSSASRDCGPFLIVSVNPSEKAIFLYFEYQDRLMELPTQWGNTFISLSFSNISIGGTSDKYTLYYAVGGTKS